MVNSARNGQRRKSGSRNGEAKKNGKKRVTTSRPWLAWALIGLGVLILLGAVLQLAIGRDHAPVPATYQEALVAFRAQGVNELLIADLAKDFASGNYTLTQLRDKYPGFEEDIRAVNAALKEGRSEVVAIVNGEEITRQELEKQRSLLPPQYGEMMDELLVLQQMIDEELIIQEARRRGAAATEEEVEESYRDLILKSGVTEEEIKENIASYGLTLDELRALLWRQATIANLFAATVDTAGVASDEEIRTFYETNQELFAKEATVTVRHILVASTPETEKKAQADAEEALARYVAGEEFCGLVSEYSDDLGSKGRCGEYTFGRNFMVPEFEEASFRLADGETEIVKTSFGHHLILKVSAEEASMTPFADVEGSIRSQLESQKRLAAYQELIAGLREAATIVNRLEPTLVGAELLEEPDGETGSSGSRTSVTILPSAPDTAESSATVTVSLASCLAENGVQLFVSDFSPASIEERVKVEADAELIVVDCTDGADPRCDAADGFFPTWVIDGKRIPRSLTIEEVSRLAGC